MYCYCPGIALPVKNRDLHGRRPHEGVLEVVVVHLDVGGEVGHHAGVHEGRDRRVLPLAALVARDVVGVETGRREVLVGLVAALPFNFLVDVGLEGVAVRGRGRAAGRRGVGAAVVLAEGVGAEVRGLAAAALVARRLAVLVVVVGRVEAEAEG